MSAIWAMRMLITCLVLVPLSGVFNAISVDRLIDTGGREPTTDQPVPFVDHGKTYYVSTAADASRRWAARAQIAVVISAVFFGVAALLLRGDTQGQRKW